VGKYQNVSIAEGAKKKRHMFSCPERRPKGPQAARAAGTPWLWPFLLNGLFLGRELLRGCCCIIAASLVAARSLGNGAPRA